MYSIPLFTEVWKSLTIWSLFRGQGRAGQDRTGQGRAGQGRAGQGRAGQGRAGQGRAGQGQRNSGSDVDVHARMLSDIVSDNTWIY